MIKINNDLKKLRSTLDNINISIASLLAERINIVKEVGNAKNETKNFYVPERENFIFKTLSKKFPEIDKNVLKSVFTEIISGCRSYEKVFNVGLLKDVYSLSALIKILGSFTNNSFFENIDSLKKEYYLLDYIIIPMDNNFTTFTRNIQDNFIVNYSEIGNKKFFLMGKKENINIKKGKIGFLIKNSDLKYILASIKNYTYNEYEINDYCFIEINYDDEKYIDEIKNIFNIPHKYLGIYPNNDF